MGRIFWETFIVPRHASWPRRVQTGPIEKPGRLRHRFATTRRQGGRADTCCWAGRGPVVFSRLLGAMDALGVHIWRLSRRSTLFRLHENSAFFFFCVLVFHRLMLII